MPKISFSKGFVSPIILGVIALILLIVVVAFFTFFKKDGAKVSLSSQTTISGTIDFNGVAPSGATIAISEKKSGDTNFTTVLQNLPAQDATSWSWNQAGSGQDYQLQASLMLNGQNIAQSDVITVSAPAQGQVLRINTADGQGGQQVPAIISGSFDLNGYIPNGSQISVLTRRIGAATFDTVSTSNPAQDNGGWSWNGAVAGYTYEIKALLVQGGQTIGQSVAISATAPAVNEVLTINSNALPPQAQVAPLPSVAQGTTQPTQSTGAGGISGVINLGGVVPGNSSLIIVARPSGTANFNVVVSGLPANSQTSWNWSGAQSGQSYDLQAVLTVNGNDYAISPTLTVTAPASNEVFNLNASSNISAPPTSPIIGCLSANGNQWNANITVNYVNGANQYWVIVGTPGGLNNQIFSSRMTAQNQGGQTQQAIQTGYVLSAGVNYVASYAYSANATSTNIGDFSPWSSQTTFQCPQ